MKTNFNKYLCFLCFLISIIVCVLSPAESCTATDESSSSTISESSIWEDTDIDDDEEEAKKILEKKRKLKAEELLRKKRKALEEQAIRPSVPETNIRTTLPISEPKKTNNTLFSIPEIVIGVGAGIGTGIGLGPIPIIPIAIGVGLFIKWLIEHKKNGGGGGGGDDDDKDKDPKKDPKDPKDPKKNKPVGPFPYGKYEENKKHHQNSRDGIGKPPRNGQEALDKSIAVPGKDYRLSVQDGKIVQLNQHGPNEYHGYIIEDFNTLDDKAKNALYNAGLVSNPKTGRMSK